MVLVCFFSRCKVSVAVASSSTTLKTGVLSIHLVLDSLGSLNCSRIPAAPSREPRLQMCANVASLESCFLRVVNPLVFTACLDVPLACCGRFPNYSCLSLFCFIYKFCFLCFYDLGVLVFDLAVDIFKNWPYHFNSVWGFAKPYEHFRMLSFSSFSLIFQVLLN